MHAETTVGWKRFHLTCLMWGRSYRGGVNGGERVPGVSEPSTSVCWHTRRFLDYVSVHCFDRFEHTLVNVNMCGNMVPVVQCWLQEDLYIQEGLRASGKDS